MQGVLGLTPLYPFTKFDLHNFIGWQTPVDT